MATYEKIDNSNFDKIDMVKTKLNYHEIKAQIQLHQDAIDRLTVDLNGGEAVGVDGK